MQPGPFPGQQVSVDHLTDQGVTDVVAVLAGLGHQQLAGDPLPQRLDQHAVVQAGHGGQQTVGDLATGHRDHLEHRLGRLGQRVHPAAKQVTDGGRQLVRAGLHGCQQLLGEEGVALRAGKDCIGQLGGWGGA
jgi:hypothetical protein